jgi:hypothetical protein
MSGKYPMLYVGEIDPVYPSMKRLVAFDLTTTPVYLGKDKLTDVLDILSEINKLIKEIP